MRAAATPRAGADAGAPLAVRERTSVGAATALVPEWRALWERVPHATPFQRPEWLVPWLETFPPHDPVLLEMRRGGRLVALAPLFLYHAGDERVLVPAGAGISDYLDVLLEPDEGDAALAALARWLAGTTRPWTRVDFLDLRDTSPLLRPWVPAAWAPAVEPHDACPVLALPRDRADLAGAVPAGQLARFRRARRHAERSGDVRVDVADEATLGTALDALVRLHGQAWHERGAPGVLADPAIQAFHRRAAPALLRAGALRLYTLRLDGEVIAALYALFERDGAYCYLQGFDRSRARLSPAMHLLGVVIEDALRAGLPWIDFLRGGEPYKYAWGARDRPTRRLRLRRRPAA
jgi:CelD/BcsL family acetyltransferase involved in cellulose biosynthesis